MNERATGTSMWKLCLDQYIRCISSIQDRCLRRWVVLVTSNDIAVKMLRAIHIHCDDQRLCWVPQWALDTARINQRWIDALIQAG